VFGAGLALEEYRVRPDPVLVLCSTSPRRRELLAQIGIDGLVFPALIDESVRAFEPASDYVERMAREKLQCAVGQLLGTAAGADFRHRHGVSAPCWLLAADTCGVAGTDPRAARILGKPEHYAHFAGMMRELSGRDHLVLSAVAVVRLDRLDATSLPALEVTVQSTTVATRVRFRTLDESAIEHYWRTGEPHDKAGGYGIQGKGALLVASIEGSYSNVVGLPLLETHQLLASSGFRTWLDSEPGAQTGNGS
jgi:septum formation protein